MYRIILKAYDAQGQEVFPERECIGATYAEAAIIAGKSLGILPEINDPAEIGRNRDRNREPTRQGDSTTGAASETREGEGE